VTLSIARHVLSDWARDAVIRVWQMELALVRVMGSMTKSKRFAELGERRQVF